MTAFHAVAGRVVLSLGCVAALAGCTPKPAAMPVAAVRPHVVAASTLEAGRYLTLVGGCNDCHTPGYNESGGATPEVHRMTGSPVGRRGPWGTSFPANLRLLTQTITEDGWVKLIRDGKSLPPMPTANMSKMSDADLRALCQYIKSLGPKGQPEPQNLPPGQEPTTPYEDMMPIAPAKAG